MEPVGVGPRVVVDERDDLPGRRFGPGVAGAAEPAVFGAYQPAVVLFGNRRRGVGGAVVDHDHFVVRILEPARALEAIAQRARAVVGADHDRDPRPHMRGRERHVAERALHGRQGRLGSAVATGDAERPVLDVGPAAVPFVGPRVDERAGAARGKRRADLPRQRPRLAVLAVAQAVETQLGHEQRPLPRQVLQAGEVGVESFFGLEVDVEAQEVGEAKIQILGGRIVDIGDETPGVGLADERAQPRKVPLDAAPAQPADDRGRDLVPDGVGEHRRMAGAAADGGQEPAFRARPPALGQVAHIALRGEPDQDLEPAGLGGIEQPAGRGRVRADGIDPVGGHEREVALDPSPVGEFVALAVGAERPVGDAADVELVCARE